MTVPESAAAVFERVEYRACWKAAGATRFDVQRVTDYDDEHLTMFWEWVSDCAEAAPHRIYWVEAHRITDWTTDLDAAQLATALAQPDTLGDGGVFERFPDAFDDRQRPVCGVWNPLLGPCVCGNPDGHTTQPSATSERGGLDE